MNISHFKAYRGQGIQFSPLFHMEIRANKQNWQEPFENTIEE